MKINGDKNKLAEATQAVQSIALAKSPIPLLSNVLIESENKILYFTTTDLEVRMRYKVDANVDADGSTTLPAKKLNDIVKAISGDSIEINIDNNIAKIKSDKARFKLLGAKSEDYPNAFNTENMQKIVMPQSELKKILEAVASYVSTSTDNYALSGVLFDISNEAIKLVATDGRRIALIVKKCKNNINENTKIVVPIKIVRELIKNLSTENIDIEILFNNNKICFNFDNIAISSVLIDSVFPDINAVIPIETNEDDKLTVNRLSFISAIKKVSLFADNDSAAIKLNILKDKIILSKSTSDVGEASDEIDAQWNKELMIGFNYKYLIDTLRTIKDDEIKIELTTADKPIVLRTSEYIYIVLPMQI